MSVGHIVKEVHYLLHGRDFLTPEPKTLSPHHKKLLPIFSTTYMMAPISSLKIEE